MAKGRKRKNVVREPNGRPSRRVEHASENQIGISPSEVRRIRTAARLKIVDSRLGSALGLLHLNGTIDENQFSAGARLAALVERYDATTGMLPRYPKGQDLMRVRGYASNSSDLEQDWKVEQAYEIVRDLMHPVVWRIVIEVCVIDAYPATFIEKMNARLGLSALVEHFGICKPNKRAA